MPREAGFTLIEVIVALVILSGIMVVFYQFVSTSFRGAGRAQAAALAYDYDQNALELASMLNPMEEPQGTLDLRAYRIDWHSQLIGDVRQSAGYPAGPGRFKVALYRMTFDFPNSRGFAPVQVTKLGYHRDVAGDATGLGDSN